MDQVTELLQRSKELTETFEQLLDDGFPKLSLQYALDKTMKANMEMSKQFTTAIAELANLKMEIQKVAKQPARYS